MKKKHLWFSFEICLSIAVTQGNHCQTGKLILVPNLGLIQEILFFSISIFLLKIVTLGEHVLNFVVRQILLILTVIIIILNYIFFRSWLFLG